MNHWALMLDQLPSGWQRLIARQHRIALPRGCDAAERVRRLRHALCHAATVRVTYDLLDPPLQHALQDLRTRRGGVRVESCHQQYGPVRSLRQITADRRPQSITEHLCLLGWLLYRPTTLRHPARYLIPPEVRRWLPRPLDLPRLGTAPPAPIPPALTAATLVLLTAAEQPLALCANTTLRQHSVRRLCDRLPTELVTNPRQLLDLVVPLLVAMDCLSTHGGVAALTSTGQRWLTQPLRARLDSLRQAWMHQPIGDHCFTPLLPHPHGIDWPVLRQRLCHWATTIPPHQWVAAPYDTLAQTWGPLANTRTHGFRYVDRAPWQPQRAARIWATALAGPLAWLGYVTLRDPYQPTAAISHDPTLACLDAAVPAWQYGAAGRIHLPLHADVTPLLRLLPYAQWHQTSPQHPCPRGPGGWLTYQITPTTLTRARQQGWGTDALWVSLTRQIGPVPPDWAALQTHQSPRAVTLEQPILLRCESPYHLQRLRQHGTIRRALGRQIAPGIVQVDPNRVPSLQRALARQGLVVQNAPTPTLASRGDSTAAQIAVACARDAQTAPADAPLRPTPTLVQQLREQLPAPLRAQVDVALTAPPTSPLPAVAAPRTIADGRQTRRVLERAVRRQHAVRLTYDTGAQGQWSQREVRPVALEQQGHHWYLRAWCNVRQDERVFRLDRIGAVVQRE